MLQEICDRVYGQGQRVKISEDTEAWKKVGITTTIAAILIFYIGHANSAVGLSKSDEDQGNASC